MKSGTTEDVALFCANAIIGLEPDGTVRQWNSAAESLFGYSAEEVTGQPVSMLISERFWALKGGKKPDEGKATCFEVTGTTKAREVIRITLLHLSEKDKKDHIMGSSVVILHPVAGEEGTDERQAILASIVNLSEDAIIGKTLGGIITSWNRAASLMFGFTPQEAIGKSISILIPPERLDEEAMILENIRRGEKIDHFETVRKAKDGSLRSVMLFVSPVRNRKGEVVGASKIARDLTFRNKAEEKQATLAAIVDSSEDAIISKTLQGVITSWNPAAIKMFGFTEAEAIGKNIFIIIPEERRNEEAVILESVRNGKKVHHFETIRRAKDGTERHISLTVSPVRNSKGEIIGASKVARDISLRIENEKQRELYTERLEELNKCKDEFMVMASHELKTPLTVIMANLDILKLMMGEDSKTDFVSKTLSQVHKLSDLITNLLDVSKIQSGKLELNARRFDINVLIRDIAGYLQQTTKLHQIIYKDHHEEWMVQADRERIEQVIINLTGNAIKYMPAPGDIIIEARHEKGFLIVSIRDEGIGVAEKDMDHIFLRFYRGSGSASSFSGSGVGLYISSEIIKAHGGRIWAHSEMGKGSVFYFSIPFAP
jgi:PAS domain S-box-containing protein